MIGNILHLDPYKEYAGMGFKSIDPGTDKNPQTGDCKFSKGIRSGKAAVYLKEAGLDVYGKPWDSLKKLVNTYEHSIN